MSNTLAPYFKSYIKRGGLQDINNPNEVNNVPNLNSAIKRSLNSLNFDFTKISSITSDNSNDIKNVTSKDFGLRNGCLCHILNFVVQNGQKLWTDNKQNLFCLQSYHRSVPLSLRSSNYLIIFFSYNLF